MTKKEKDFECAREAFISEILHDDNTSKLEKLQMIEKYNLFSIDPYLPHIFEEEERQLENLIKERYSPPFVTVDDMFSGPGSGDRYERYETVIIPDLISELSEYENAELITVATARSAKEKMEMTAEEVIDKLYDWCVETKQIGFKIDW